ncbi:MAG: hypothetical protein KIS81_00650 [Maricaulaceae bacterium]|nr:hypothetical protein [Maricaulaceae bacterium]
MSATRQTYRELDDAEQAAVALIKARGEDFLQTLSRCVPQEREQALARTKIEEAVMWAVKGVTG